MEGSGTLISRNINGFPGFDDGTQQPKAIGKLQIITL